jgi:hypothetical protein
MDQAAHNKIVSFIWGIADDVVRNLFVRGKYRDVILPMCVLRRLDAVLEESKKTVLDTKKMLDEAGITEQRPALCAASGQAFLQHIALHSEGSEEPNQRSSCAPTSRPTSTATRPTSRTSSTTSSFATSWRGCPGPTRLAR